MHAAAQQRPPAGTVVLDHVSHFVSDLSGAENVLEALGFAVTPRSAQRAQDGPAGSANVCIMLEEGYLEFLAPVANTPNARRLRTAMQRYRGAHLACFGTPAADEEHARLGRHGFDPLPVVHVERPVEAGSETQMARFKVVRLPPDAMPEGRIQFVEHLTPEVLWQPRFLRHANGVTGLACVFVVAEDVVKTAARWARFAALLPQPARDYVHLATSRGHVLVGTRARWQALLGSAPDAPALAGYALECGDPSILAALLERRGLAPRCIRPQLYAVALPPALGGSWLFGTRHSLAFPR